METKDTLSLCSDSEEQQMQQIQDKAKKSCMVSFQLLHSHLKLLSNNELKGTRTECGFKCAFATLFGQDVETFTGTMFLNVDQLEKQLDKEEFQDIGPMAAFKVLETQFQTKRIFKKRTKKKTKNKQIQAQGGKGKVMILKHAVATASAQNDNGSLEAESNRSSSLNKSTVPSFDNAVLFRCFGVNLISTIDNIELYKSARELEDDGILDKLDPMKF
ncbi:hypothetical protein Tco_1212300 [Tanacetum coccineum]